MSLGQTRFRIDFNTFTSARKDGTTMSKLISGDLLICESSIGDWVSGDNGSVDRLHNWHWLN
jgi:hypothetical protein